MTPIQTSKTILRLQKYVETVNTNISGSSGELKLFWQRELKKAKAKIAGLSL